MAKILNRIAAGFKLFVFGEDENDTQEELRGKLYLKTPKSRVKFESELRDEEDFDRAISLLTNEKKILFYKKF